MPKQKQNLNTIYISERLHESLKPISHCTLTTVVAPMGYGKTTAINWYLAERTKREELYLCQKYEVRQQELDNAGPRPMVLSSLTDREHEIVMLLQQRLNNREIGEKLFLSEGSVKQYINQIYSKLHIRGDTRTKRKQLLELLSSNN